VTRVSRSSGPVAIYGLTDPGSCTFTQVARSAAGRTGVKLQWRMTASLVGAPDVAGMQASYTPIGSGGSASLSAAVTGLHWGIPYGWQARSRSRSVYFPATAWYSNPRNGALEWDLRVPGTGLDAPIAHVADPMLMLSAPSPNPSRAGSRVDFGLPRAAKVRIAVYDAQGRRIRQIVDAFLPEGRHEARWDGAREDGTQAETGVYFYRFEADGARNSRTVAVIR